MPAITTCTGCKTKMRLPDEYLNKTVKCPKCSQPFKAVPDAPAGPPAKAPAGTAAPAKTAPAAPKPAPPAPAVKPKPTTASAAKAAPPKPAASKPAEEVEVGEAAEEEEVNVDAAAEEENVDVEEAADEEEVDVDAASDEDTAGLIKKDPFEGLEIPKEFIKCIKAELTSTEKIVWVGRSSKKLKMSDARIAVILGFVFMVIGGGMACGSFLLMSTLFGAFIGLLIFGIIFAGIGVLATFAPKFMAKYMHLREVYVLTNRRVLMWDSASERTANMFRQYNALKVAGMERKNSMRQQGAGDLIFAYELDMMPSGGGRNQMPTKVPRGFLKIERVSAVEKLVRETLVNRRIDRSLS